MKSIGIGAEWNQFDPTKTPMTGPDSSGAWHASVPLPPGAYGYKYVLTDGAGTQTWILDPQNPYSKYVGTTENSLREVDDCQNPSLTFLELDKARAARFTPRCSTQTAPARPGSIPRRSRCCSTAPASGVTVDATGKIVVDASSLSKDKHRLAFQAADRAGHAPPQLDVPFWIEAQPFDFRDGMLYFIFTDRFQNGSTRATTTPTMTNVDRAPTIRAATSPAIAQEIEAGYFDQLGVGTIWISPPFPTPDGEHGGDGHDLYSGYHGYWPDLDGTRSEPRFGDLAALKAMVATAHQHGIRVLVDSVLNHVHIETPTSSLTSTTAGSTATAVACAAGRTAIATRAPPRLLVRPYLPDLNYEPSPRW